jgi:transposase-like protein
MRQRAVKAVKEGQSPEVVALAFGINKRSLYRWLADFASDVVKYFQTPRSVFLLPFLVHK